jgi:hypothetical protein
MFLSDRGPNYAHKRKAEKTNLRFCCAPHAAIAILRRLVEQEGRAELANALAMAIMNRGILDIASARLAEAYD